MSDIESNNNNNISLQGEDPEEEINGLPNEAGANNDVVPALDLEALHSLLAHCNPNDELKGAKLEQPETAISNEVVEAKNRRGIFGNRDYLCNIKAAMTPVPVELKMGVPSHFVSSHDGETETGDQTKYQIIEEVFVSNADKLQQALLHTEYYGMMPVFMLHAVCDKNGTRPNEIFNNDGKDVFLHLDSLKWENVCLWEKTLNKWAGDDDSTISRWAQESFLYKLSTLTFATKLTLDTRPSL